jgi:F0F1-type ATP synthase membrane subunit b/b'
MLEVKRYMADLVVSAAAKILEDSLDKATQERLMMEFVRKVPETN